MQVRANMKQVNSERQAKYLGRFFYELRSVQNVPLKLIRNRPWGNSTDSQRSTSQKDKKDGDNTVHIPGIQNHQERKQHRGTRKVSQRKEPSRLHRNWGCFWF